MALLTSQHKTAHAQQLEEKKKRIANDAF